MPVGKGSSHSAQPSHSLEATGDAGRVAIAWPDVHDPGRAWFKACSENDLRGSCKEVTIDYTY